MLFGARSGQTGCLPNAAHIPHTPAHTAINKMSTVNQVFKEYPVKKVLAVPHNAVCLHPNDLIAHSTLLDCLTAV